MRRKVCRKSFRKKDFIEKNFATRDLPSYGFSPEIRQKHRITDFNLGLFLCISALLADYVSLVQFLSKDELKIPCTHISISFNMPCLFAQKSHVTLVGTRTFLTVEKYKV
ncbi:hypothetical protein M5K25_017265 [Dendrobium thyrsiflorum]|uniref:Uncharacterized protein n=1 Tax=Dendrobium thyrsiflorum TaxID=117978 RepID=A0ABD0UM52_DENTH